MKHGAVGDARVRDAAGNVSGRSGRGRDGGHDGVGSRRYGGIAGGGGDFEMPEHPRNRCWGVGGLPVPSGDPWERRCDPDQASPDPFGVRLLGL